MTSRERVLCALKGGTPDRVPYCELGVDPPIIQSILEREGFFEERGGDDGCAGWDPLPETGGEVPDGEERANPAEVECALSRALGKDNICYRFVPEIPVRKEGGKDAIPFFREGLVKTEADLDKIRLPDPEDDAIYEPARRFLQKRGDFAVTAVGRLGLSPTYLAMGTENFWIALKENPRFVEAVLERFTSWSAAVLERVCEMGFDFLWLADDMAFKTSTFFSPETYRRHLLPHLRKVTDRLTLPWVLHSDGNILPLLEDALEALGPSALHPLEPEAVDILAVKKRYGKQVCLIGNVSVHLLSVGTTEAVRNTVLNLIRRVAPGGGYILSSGNSLTHYCKIENIFAMVETLQAHGGY